MFASVRGGASSREDLRQCRTALLELGEQAERPGLELPLQTLGGEHFRARCHRQHHSHKQIVKFQLRRLNRPASRRRTTVASPGPSTAHISESTGGLPSDLDAFPATHMAELGSEITGGRALPDLLQKTPRYRKPAPEAGSR